MNSALDLRLAVTISAAAAAPAASALAVAAAALTVGLAACPNQVHCGGYEGILKGKLSLLRVEFVAFSARRNMPTC